MRLPYVFSSTTAAEVVPSRLAEDPKSAVAVNVAPPTSALPAEAAALKDAQSRIDELESQIKILTLRATSAGTTSRPRSPLRC